MMNQNDGDDSEQGGMISMLMNMNAHAAQSEVTPEKIELFREQLTKNLMEMRDMNQRLLEVDYDPCLALSTAADHAGIDYGAFPCKTFTSIREKGDGFIAISKYQYQGDFIEL